MTGSGRPRTPSGKPETPALLAVSLMVLVCTGASGCAFMALGSNPALMGGAMAGNNMQEAAQVETTADRVSKAQRILLSLGYEPGPVDGIMGPRTEQAIRKYQQDNDLKVDGKLSSFLWNFPGL